MFFYHVSNTGSFRKTECSYIWWCETAATSPQPSILPNWPMLGFYCFLILDTQLQLHVLVSFGIVWAISLIIHRAEGSCDASCICVGGREGRAVSGHRAHEEDLIMLLWDRRIPVNCRIATNPTQAWVDVVRISLVDHWNRLAEPSGDHPGTTENLF